LAQRESVTLLQRVLARTIAYACTFRQVIYTYDLTKSLELPELK